MLTQEQDLNGLVQAVRDAGVELTGPELGVLFYNLLDETGESFALRPVRPPSVRL